jgi:hypothetical protein
MHVERNEHEFSVDASIVGELLAVPPSSVQALMRDNEITSLCERGEGEHAGLYRLTFFYKGRRARLSIDGSGKVIRRSIVDLGDRHRPPSVQNIGGFAGGGGNEQEERNESDLSTLNP